MKAQAKFTAHTNTLLCESRIDPNPKSLSWARGCVPCTDWRLCWKIQTGKVLRVEADQLSITPSTYSSRNWCAIVDFGKNKTPE